MTPFDLDEILPDFEPVRLPRRQNGNSPQGLAVTLLTDYTLRARARLPSAAIVALLVESGVTPGGARTTISRLARRGVLDSSRQGRHTFYRLTQPTAIALAIGGEAIAAFATRAESWDGRWTLIAFSLPKGGDTQRRALRGRLRWLGYAPLYDGLWVSPHRLPREAVAALSEIAPGATTVFRARQVDLDMAVAREPLDAWELASTVHRYESFVQRWSPLLPRIGSGDVGGAEAVRARTEVMDTYRRFIGLDPCLPMRLMPAGWPREHAREVFVAVYDGLGQPALRHVSDLVARVTGSRQPDITIHTVADMLTGVLPGSGPTRMPTPP
ncbi:MAG: PaaX family transcriptional regulator [Dactylosporangium sp.]|nr:PaaX family transcriptional regulator [Dactylosporangium sp.]NNJ63513.1 PaaX family transcriptional regulator [Dactylosporangium sp.]